MYKQRSGKGAYRKKANVLMNVDYHIEDKKGKDLKEGGMYKIDISIAEFLVSEGFAIYVSSKAYQLCAI
ncbi:hypothetical protein M5X17_31330 [Paenibacillus alvei]|uniref:hypothetical protein n=1 Tax=Paenibacillus alvei TaxID=44250 RepID=UPI00228162F6|nr:hypothetical protein [Paenibacillus alvei]MCY9738187.1 hypothetical protein [Paenibacillus alvei]